MNQEKNKYKRILGANARQSGQLLQFCPILAVLVRASRVDVCTFSGLGYLWVLQRRQA